MSGKSPLGLSKDPQSYEGINIQVPVKGWRLVTSPRSPTSNDKLYPLGSIWVNTTTNAAYILTSAPGNWSLFGSSSAGAINSITGDSGGAKLPSSGNFNLLGTANQVTVTGTSATETFSIPSAFVAPGSITATTSVTSTTTMTAGTGVTATTGNISATAGSVSAGTSVSATTSVTAGTSITATAGDITATLGNVIINGAAKQLRVHGGAVTDFIGTGTLANGTVTIANTNIAATDRIFIQRIAANGSTTMGELSYTISAATSFTVTSLILGTPGSTQTGDTSTFAYFIVRQV